VFFGVSWAASGVLGLIFSFFTFFSFSLSLSLFSGSVGTIGGTSASSPSLAGLIALLNDQRFTAGKSSLGFLNPLFYQNPSVFIDITTGSNPGCQSNGFPAQPEWDPVTGLGTPNFQKLSQLINSLP
jgi:tripeptidyl-peptidase-1